MSDVTMPLPAPVRGRDVAIVTAVMVGFLIAAVAGISLLALGARGVSGYQMRTLLAIHGGSTLVAAAILGSVHIALLRRRVWGWRDFGFVPVRGTLVVGAVVAGVVFVPAVVIFQIVVGVSLEDISRRLIAPFGFSWGALMLTVTTLGVLVPIAEEVYFRGILFAWLRSRFGLWPGAVVSGALFSLTHLQYPLPFIAVIAVLGVILALFYTWGRSLWLPVAMHAAYNTTGIVLVYVAVAG